MSESAGGSGQSASCSKEKKASKAPGAKKPSHPPVSDMVLAAINHLKERNGSSAQAIKKYIAGNYKVDVERMTPFIKKYLKQAVTGGVLVQTKGKGAYGSFKVAKGAAIDPAKAKAIKAAKPKGPKEIIVELHPATNDAWLRVHSLAQNPRLRIRVPLQKRLSKLISYLENRWSSARLRELELNSLTGVTSGIEKDPDKLRLMPHSSMTEDLTGIVIKRIPLNINSQFDLSLSALNGKKLHQNSSKKEKENDSTEKKRKNATASTATISTTHASSSSSPSPSASNMTQKNKNGGSPDHKETKSGIKSSSSNETECTLPLKSTDSLENHANNVSNLPPIAETVRSLTRLNDILDSATEPLVSEQEVTRSETSVEEIGKEELTEEEVTENEKDNLSPILPIPPANATIGEWLGASTANENEQQNSIQNKDDKQALPELCEPEIITVVPNEKDQNNCHQIELGPLKTGWTNESVDILIGELYLIFKTPPKIVLEYDWISKESNEKRTSEKGEECKEEQETQSVLNKLITVANIALMSLKSQQNGGDTLRLSPIKSKSYSRKNKRLKLGSPPPSTHSHLVNSVVVTTALTSLTPSLSTSVTTDLSTSLPQNKEVIISNCTSSSSNLLSSVISDTILNGRLYQESSLNSVEKEPKSILDSALSASQHNTDTKTGFIVPSSPAPKAIKKTNKIICNNPALLQEAIKQLNINRFSTRKSTVRKPPIKPTYIPKPLISSLRHSKESINNSVGSRNHQTNSTILNQTSKSATTCLIPSQVMRQTVPITVIPSSSSKGNFVVGQAKVSVPVEMHQVIASSSSTSDNDLINLIRSPLFSSTLSSGQKSASPLEMNPGVSSPVISSSVSGLKISSEGIESRGSGVDLQISNSGDVSSNAPSSLNLHISAEKKEESSKDSRVPTSDSSSKFTASPPNLSSIFDISLGETPSSIFHDASLSSLSEVLGLDSDRSGRKTGETVSCDNHPPFKDLLSLSSPPIGGNISPPPLAPQSNITSNSACVLKGSDPLVSLTNSNSKSNSSFPLKENSRSDVYWLNGDSSEVSLISMFEATNSISRSEKNGLPVGLTNDPRLNFSDNSVDLIAKFVDLTEKMQEDISKSS